MHLDIIMLGLDCERREAMSCYERKKDRSNAEPIKACCNYLCDEMRLEVSGFCARNAKPCTAVGGRRDNRDMDQKYCGLRVQCEESRELAVSGVVVGDTKCNNGHSAQCRQVCT